MARRADTGKGVFEAQANLPGLRQIAKLCAASVRLVARLCAGIKTVAGLQGKQVALDEPGSDTLIDARTILAAHGLKDADLKPDSIQPNQAGDGMKDGASDAFFFVGATQADAVRKRNGFFLPEPIAADT